VSFVSIDGQNYAIVDYNDGDYIPILDIQNIEKMIGMQFPRVVNAGNWETVIKVQNIIFRLQPYYSITIFYGVDILDGRLPFRLYKQSIGYVFQWPAVGPPIRKAVFEIVTEDKSLYNSYLTSDDCKTPDKFLEFIYVSLERKITNNNPF
jgi:hypothetical protein